MDSFRTKSRHAALVSSTALALQLACYPVTAAQPNAQPDSPREEQSLVSFLRTIDQDKHTRYIASFVDLAADHSDAAIVYLLGPDWCGSGGCETLVLKQRAGTWQVVTKMTLTHPPIRVLSTTSQGWHDIGVWVQGGGIRAGYEAVLKFNGRKYPSNPTVLPATKSGADPVPGEIVIDTTTPEKPLNP